MLLALGAVLTLAQASEASGAGGAGGGVSGPVGVATRTVPLSSFFKSYRKVDMGPKEIIMSVTIPLTREHEFVRAYKQARPARTCRTPANSNLT